jgi:ADP-ribosylglycohydrolase
MPGWESLSLIVAKERRQRIEEGFDVRSLPSPETYAGLDDQALLGLLDQLNALPKREEFPYIEPDDYDAIIGAYRSLIQPARLPRSSQFLGAVVGRSVGCILGKPLEAGPYFWESTLEKPGWKNIKAWFEGANQYPIRDYVPATSKATFMGLYVWYPTCQKGNIQFVETDDDLRYTLLSLELLEQKGTAFTSYDVGKLWHERLPYQLVCTAETQAYLNFAQVTTHLGAQASDYTEEAAHYVRMHHNPYREWIGAQIRIDGYGYAAAGNPLLAAKMAYQDAHFSHVKNGVYGAMFFAALIASAFVETDLRRCIDQALTVIPSTSRLYEALVRTITIVEDETDTERMIDKVWVYLLDVDPAHTINNACVCVASILHAPNDFTKAIGTAVLFGLDTDCNGATVGSVMGAFLGEGAISDHWKKPLNDTMYSMLAGYHPIAISDVALRYQALYDKHKNTTQ